MAKEWIGKDGSSYKQNEDGLIYRNGHLYLIGETPHFWLYFTLVVLIIVAIVFNIVYMAYNAGMIHVQYW